MRELLERTVDQLLESEGLRSALRAFLIVVGGFFFARLVARRTGRAVKRRFAPQEAMLARRFVFYGLLGLVLATALNQLGFELTVLLGAAGVLTVAAGFAAQTSASNIISGLFLIAERPFVVGDVIQVGDTTGEVLSIDLLSVKIRTFDNRFVRVPNEEIIRSKVTTLTRFPIRRVDVPIGVAYKEDVGRVEEILRGVATRNPISLEQPAPLVIFQGFGESSLDFQFSIWTKQENFLGLKNSIQREIKAAFDAAGIEIPFPQRSLHAGSTTEPFPVRVVGTAAGGVRPRGEDGVSGAGER
ncbi:MAG: mechanosensitive ion channel family protein [Planctomycetota bacterium]